VTAGRKRSPIGARQPLIRELFVELGEGSVIDLANRSGFAQEHIHKIRRGKMQNPQFKTIVDLGQALGLTLKWVRE
jgi:DNA-binding phage protein